MAYVATHQETGETSYYLLLTEGPLGGREIRVFEPTFRYVDEDGSVYDAEGGEPYWVGGCCYNIILWHQR